MIYRGLFVDGGLAVASWMASGTLRPFVRRVLEARRQYEPAITGIAWDAPRETTWRRALSPAYKANRPERAEGLTSALAALRADLPALDIAQYSGAGAEADDVIHTLSRTMPGPTLIYSADKDLLQSMRPGVDLLRAGTRGAPDHLVTAASSEKTSAWWTDYLTLAGDPVDGVPGLRGVGVNRATELLAACPWFVDLVLSAHDEDHDEARRKCMATSAKLAKWVEAAITHREELQLSHDLISLRLVELDVVDSDPDEGRAREILSGANLEDAA